MVEIFSCRQLSVGIGYTLHDLCAYGPSDCDDRYRRFRPLTHRLVSDFAAKAYRFAIPGGLANHSNSSAS